MCNLVSIATRVGAPRIVPTRGIPWPAGDPTLAPADERAWRLRLLRTALRAVATPVTKPTVFEVPVGDGDGANGKEDGMAQAADDRTAAEPASA